jgi:hypothetical protein
MGAGIGGGGVELDTDGAAEPLADREAAFALDFASGRGAAIVGTSEGRGSVFEAREVLIGVSESRSRLWLLPGGLGCGNGNSPTDASS